VAGNSTPSLAGWGLEEVYDNTRLVNKEVEIPSPLDGSEPSPIASPSTLSDLALNKKLKSRKHSLSASEWDQDV
jgi:hypothetical protein